MTGGGENCQVKVPAVLLLEMTSVYIQVLLRVKGKPKFPSSPVHESSKQDMDVYAWIPCPSISPLHSKDFQLLWNSYIGLHKLPTTYAFPLSINLSLVKYWRKK